MASRFAAVTNKEISQITKQAVPEISEGDEFCLEVLTGNLCLFDLNLSMKPVKNVFVYKCKCSSLALLYVAELFINKLKTKFNSFFSQNGFKYKENSQLLLSKFPRKS